MRIDRLTLQNFRKFETLTLELHPQFTLLVGVNGSGKTTILDALAISLYVWGMGSVKTIQPKDVRLTTLRVGDRVQFQEQLPVSVEASGQIGPREGLKWRQIFDTNARWSSVDKAQKAINQLRVGNQLGTPSDWPVIASYGVTRASFSPSQRSLHNLPLVLTPARREEAYTHWLSERIDYDDLLRWFFRETAAAGANGGRKRPGYEVVRKAVFDCLPGADDLWFDIDRVDLVCSIDGQAQPLSNLSDGQRMLLAMVADIAGKAVTLNAHLLPPDELGPEDKPLPRVLKQTPGVVLIDELDVHLHPSWQRRVVEDLKRTFPAIQFISTTHSPQVISEAQPDNLVLLRDEAGQIIPQRCGQAYGLDANYVLEHIMGTTSRAEPATRAIQAVEDALETGDLESARVRLQTLRNLLHGDDAAVVGLEATINNLEALADATDSEGN